MLVTGEAVHVWRQRVCEKALCLPLRLCCESKTALKKQNSLGNSSAVPWLRCRASFLFYFIFLLVGGKLLYNIVEDLKKKKKDAALPLEGAWV